MPTPAPNTYPFDGTGTAATNLVQNELHTLTIVNFRDYHFIVPGFAPFFAESLVLQYRPDSSSAYSTLTEGIDYYPALSFIGATRATAKPVYGAISFNNLSLEGEVKISYQTVGGEWTLSLTKLTEIIANIIYNPRTTTWESITNPPDYFPPLAHAWQMSDLVGQEQILEMLEAIRDAILGQDVDADLLNHISNFSNPHRVSKAQVGLPLVQNYAPATIAETIAATRSDLYVTPNGLRAYFDSLGLDKALNFVSLQEVVDKVSVPKILTFDLFLEYMRLYGGDDGTAPPSNTTIPLIAYPLDQGTYVKDQLFKTNTFVDSTPGTINKIITITGTGSHTVPTGTNSVKITGRGGIGGVVIPPFVTKTETLTGTGNGTFTIPAGGSILSIRGRGAAGTANPAVFNYSLTPGNFTPGTVINPAVFTDYGTDSINGESLSYDLKLELVSINYVANSINSNNFADEVGGANGATNYPVGVFKLRKVYDVTTLNPTAPPTAYVAGQLTFDLRPYSANVGTPGTHDYSVLNLVINKVIGNTTTLPNASLIFTTQSNLPFTLPAPTGLVVSSLTRATTATPSVSPGLSASVTIAGAVRTYAGSSTTSSPAVRIDEASLNPTAATTVQFSSPAGTELQLIYQDFSANGTWEVKRYYSSKITNPSSGTNALLEDTNGTIVALPTASTGEWMSTRTNVVLEPSASITTAYTLQLVAAASNSTRRVFETTYTLSGTAVTIRVVAELIVSSGNVSQGPNATVVILGNTLVYSGSPDNNTVPQIRTDDITLNSNTSTTLTYDCPTGTSVVLNYNEPNTAQPITHADTIWQVSTTSSFAPANIVEGTVVGKGSNFTLVQWKPTTDGVLINNTDYYVRVKWVRSDATQSEWSEIKKFSYSSGITHPPRDTELTRFCKGFDQWGTYADGNGGSYEKVIQVNSSVCGYTTPPTSTNNVSLSNVNMISSLSTIPFGSTSTITITLNGTIPGRAYTVEFFTRLSGATGYTTWPANIPTVTGDPTGSTTVFTFGLNDPTGGTNGTYEAYVKVTDSLTSTNTRDSNKVFITFTDNRTSTPTPTLTGTFAPTPSVTQRAIVLTVSTTHMQIKVGDPEKITISLTNGTPNTSYALRLNATQISGAFGPITTSDTDFTLTTNSSGTGTHVVNAGNDGGVVPVPSVWNTKATTRNLPTVVTSNVLARSFIAGPQNNNAAIVNRINGATTFGPGETGTVVAAMTGFSPNTQYTVKWWNTPPGQGRAPWAPSSGAQQQTMTTFTDGSGNASPSWVATNTGVDPTGTYSFDSQVFTMSGVAVPTPGGNTPGSFTLVRNTVVHLSSNLGTYPQVPHGQSETLTVTVSGGPVNSTVSGVLRGKYISGNTGGVADPNHNYDTPFTINTNSSGAGQWSTAQAGNPGGAVPAPSEWTRQAIATSIGVNSNLMNVSFLAPVVSAMCEVVTNATITGVSGPPERLVITGYYNKTRSDLKIKRMSISYNEGYPKMIFCSDTYTTNTPNYSDVWGHWNMDVYMHNVIGLLGGIGVRIVGETIANSNNTAALSGGDGYILSSIDGSVINADGSFTFIANRYFEGGG